MTLTAKQRSQVSKVSPVQKAALRAMYNAQNREAPKSAPARGLQQAPPRDLRSMPAAIKAHMKQMIAAQLKSIPRGPVGGHTNQEMFRAALRSSQFAPRGHGYYDAFANKCENVLLGAAVGPATCIHGAALTTIPSTNRVSGSYEYVVGTAAGGGGPLTGTKTLTTNKKLVIFNPGSSDSAIGVVIDFVHPMTAGQTDPTNLDTTKISCRHSELIIAQQFGDLGPALQHNSNQIDQLDGNSLSTSLDPGDRVESIPLRGSLRIKNVTENVAVGGSVRVLRYNGSVRYWKDPAGHRMIDLGISESGASGTNFSEPDVQMVLQLCDMIESSERTRHYNGKELLVSHQINTHPADFVRSTTFETDKHFQEVISRTRYNTVMILIDDFASSNNSMSNTYELCCQVHRAGRFSPGSILHAKGQELGGDPTMAARMATLESKMGSILGKVNGVGKGAANPQEGPPDTDPLG